MDGETILTVSASVVALTQLIKWAGVPGKLGPLTVLMVSALGVAVWVVANGQFGRADIWPLFAGWISISLSSAGVFGFTRPVADRLTQIRNGG